MGLLASIFWTMTTTKNWWDAYPFYFIRKPRRICIRGSNFCEIMDFKNYSALRYLNAKGFTPIVVNNEIIMKYREKYIFWDPTLHDLFYTSLQSSCIEHGKLDYHQRVVLDIGGFLGETAVLFSAWGASKIIVYEPFYDHRKYIAKNVEINKINAEIHMEGIGESNGFLGIHYEVGDSGFGFYNKGSKIIKIKTRKPEDILIEAKPDIVKIDCEGAELCLLAVSNDVLGSIHQYVIECHSAEIQKKLIDKFKSLSFSYEIVTKYGVIYFFRKGTH